MTNEQILKKAIDKAIKNGWPGWVCPWKVKGSHKNWGVELNTEGYDPTGKKTHFIHSLMFIFSHDFAEAFAKYLIKEKNEMVSHLFGMWATSDKVLSANAKIHIVKKWLLQTMVIEKDPIKYLEKFL